MTIPKIIHQLWIGPKPPPTKFMDTWRDKNPEFQYIRWNEDEDRWEIPNFPLSVENGIYNSEGDLLLQGGASGGGGAHFEIKDDGTTTIDSDTITFRKQDATDGTTLDVKGAMSVKDGIYNSSGILFLQGGAFNGAGANFEINSNGTTTIDSDSITFRKQDTSDGTTLDVKGDVDVSGDLSIGSLFPVLQSNKTRITYGFNTSDSSSAAQYYGVTYTSTPFIFTQMVANSSNKIFAVNIYNIDKEKFSYRKLYTQNGGLVTTAGSEDFYWIAIGQIS